ncbi:uracil-DNA glycosylase family protein [Negadavirga shengliensis]|uniref:Uracil-DNA glycosylase family protein n=1 Tax=Negadavirga shengliensis TaxID=1389218 RepID=A0ABV9SVJ0_9BACT
MTFAEKIIAFNKELDIPKGIPSSIRMMNPYQENGEAMDLSASFYRKFYNDRNPRKLILGINPGRLGAGLTGIPFTDTQRLIENCGISTKIKTYEPSAVFVYEMIAEYGGAEAFYADCFFNSVCPLGFVKIDAKGREKNLNYYDEKQLEERMTSYILASLEKLIKLDVVRERVICLGTGKNFKFLSKINRIHRFFNEIIPLEHPRYIMQYRSKEKQQYIRKYLEVLK